ncbi:MAG TPA: hypothetical protein VJN18_32315 [Polyangiaceae bacterium]|nr:hypothetical protein [Polyangiaceae bacterium]
MRDEPSNVIRVRFRKPRPKRRGLALSLAAGDGYVFIAASGRAKYTPAQTRELIQDLRDCLKDAKARSKRG